MARARKSLLSLAAGWSPFGVGHQKPAHFRDMLRIAWENRDALPYAWKVLTQGVCDGCALGTTGLSDWTIPGTHLCMVRLELLRLNTMGALDEGRLADVASLAGTSSKDLRALGRIPHPLRRRRGEKGFQRVGWDEMWRDVGARWSATDPSRTAMFVTSRGITNETYYVAQKVMRYLGSNSVDNSARLCHSPSTSGLKTTIGVAATTCSYTDWFDADLIVFLGSNPANDQPVTTKYLAEAKRRGARILSVNALREPGLERYWIPSTPESALFGTRLCDRHYLVGVGGDLAFLTAVSKVVVAQGWPDTRIAAVANAMGAAMVQRRGTGRHAPHRGREAQPETLHRCPSHLLICETSSPPMRACTRPPHAITSTSASSSGRGASGTPTSMASKWERT